MKKKLTGIFLCMLLITTYIAPIIAVTTKGTLNEPRNDSIFDQKIKLLMKLAGFPSLSTCIIKDDQLIWSKGYGYYDRAAQKPATPDTIYIIASITKTIVGTALMQLYDKGLFNLDDDVNIYLPFDLRNPSFPDDPITIRMLLSHTASLNDHDTLQYYWQNFSGDPPFDFFPEPYLREYLVPGGRYYDPSIWNTTYRPGEYRMYANVGFDLISYLVELISGEPFLEYCDFHIFSPLDMKNTGFNLSRFDINQVAIPYQRIMLRYYTINELGYPAQYWRPRFYPAGGLYTTVSDLSHFLIAHMNDGVYNGTRILQKETVELMHTPQPGNPISGILWYGLAWYHETIFGMDVSGHAGDISGVDTWMLFNDTENIGVIYFANGNPGFSLLPFQGLLTVQLILFSLFTKEGALRGEMEYEFTILSNPFFLILFKQFLEAIPKQ